MKELKALTSIRGIAAIFVMLGHLFDRFKHVSDNPIWTIADRGSLGVDMFFILSGFILAYVYHARLNNKFSSFYAKFIITRFFRIYPLHIFIILFLFVLTVSFPSLKQTASAEYFGFDALIANLFLVQSWGFTEVGWNLPSWSISTEWAAYLLFPIMLFVLLKLQLNNIWLYIALSVFIFMFHMVMVKVLNLPGFGGIGKGGLVRCLFEFSLGLVLYEVRLRFIATSKLSNKLSYAALVFMLISLVFETVECIFIPATALLIFSLSYEKCQLSKILANKTIFYLGQVSFSLYLWHAVVLRLITWGQRSDVIPYYQEGNLVVYFPIYCVVLIIVSHFSYKYIEFSMHNLGRKISQNVKF